MWVIEHRWHKKKCFNGATIWGNLFSFILQKILLPFLAYLRYVCSSFLLILFLLGSDDVDIFMPEVKIMVYQLSKPTIVVKMISYFIIRKLLPSVTCLTRYSPSHVWPQLLLHILCCELCYCIFVALHYVFPVICKICSIIKRTWRNWITWTTI